MKNILLAFCLSSIMFACGGKKEFIRSDTVANLRTNEQLYAELYRTTRLLELLDIKIRQVETRDSSGNVRIETSTDISKCTEERNLDTTKISSNKQVEGEKATSLNTGKERSGVIGSWVWIIGFMAIIVMALVAGIYIVKK